VTYSRRLTMTAGGLCLLFAASCAVTESDHHHQMKTEAVSPGMATGARQALDLAPAVQEALKLTMREHLEALQAIVAALAQEDYQKAAAVAHEDLGFPKHHQAMQREQGAPFPPKYQELAMAHHQVAEDLAQAIPSRDMKKILPQLERTMKACVACHQAYKL
jgi:cytochrome c556